MSLPPSPTPARYTSPILEYFKTTLNHARSSSGPWSGKSWRNNSRKISQSDISLSCTGKDHTERGLGSCGHSKIRGWAALELWLQGLKKKRIANISLRIVQLELVMKVELFLLPTSFSFMSGKLFLTLCGCFCANDWVQNTSASISLL